MGRIAGVSPEETRERLVDAAADVFERRGYEKTTVAEVASEAGVSTGAIYAHYANKAELLADALRCHGGRVTASLLPPGTRFDAVDVLVALAGRLANEEGADAALLAEALLASRRDTELSAVLVEALGEREEMMASVVADGQAKGVLSDEVSPTVAARFALMLGLGSMLIRRLDMPPVDHDDWLAFIHRLIGAFAKEDHQ